MDKKLVFIRTGMGRRQAFGNIHQGVGLSQEDIEHLRQVIYIFNRFYCVVTMYDGL